MEILKYPRTYHFPFSPGTTSDDRIKHDWQAILANELVITEKLDGENTCIKSDGVYARSHAAPTLNPWAKNMWTIWEQIKNSLGDLDVFGENLYGLHSIEYSNLESYFYIFAIRDGDKWLSWDEVVFYAQLLDLPTVPVLARGIFTENDVKMIINTALSQGSQLGGACEGVVCRTSEGFETAVFSDKLLKYVRKNHVKTDEHWTRNWQRAKLRFERAID
jgi:RNA ligase